MIDAIVGQRDALTAVRRSSQRLYIKVLFVWGAKGNCQGGAACVYCKIYLRDKNENKNRRFKLDRNSGGACYYDDGVPGRGGASPAVGVLC